MGKVLRLVSLSFALFLQSLLLIGSFIRNAPGTDQSHKRHTENDIVQKVRNLHVLSFLGTLFLSALSMLAFQG